MKNSIRRVRVDDARDLAQRALDLGAVAEIEALLNDRRASLEATTGPNGGDVSLTQQG